MSFRTNDVAHTTFLANDIQRNLSRLCAGLHETRGKTLVNQIARLTIKLLQIIRVLNCSKPSTAAPITIVNLKSGLFCIHKTSGCPIARTLSKRTAFPNKILLVYCVIETSHVIYRFSVPSMSSKTTFFHRISQLTFIL